MSQLRGGISGSTLELLLGQWKLLCNKPPKGFEKYFETGKKVLKQKTENEAEHKESKPSGSQSSPSPPPPSLQQPPSPGSKSFDDSIFSRFMGRGPGGKG